MKDPRQIVLRPIVTEKTADARESTNTVCFQVARGANKIEVRRAVEVLFGVKVVDVRVMNVRGKERRYGRYTGKRPDWRKAYVRLAAGEKSIEFFDQV
ncbi:MAG TPA: 50S ribosomal protein L23 [Thermoanaerobaculaceae bacterium]|nr:50S ribosomal protein L23 [Thermoanaerobaculaceae bacterium]